jgi:hypothetical protein
LVQIFHSFTEFFGTDTAFHAAVAVVLLAAHAASIWQLAGALYGLQSNQYCMFNLLEISQGALHHQGIVSGAAGGAATD